MQLAQLQALKVPELKAQLKARGLKVSGKKAVLVQRLLNPQPTDYPQRARSPRAKAAAARAAPLSGVPTYAPAAVAPATAGAAPVTVAFTGGLPPLTVAQPAKKARKPRKKAARKSPRKKRAASPRRSPKKVAAGNNFAADLAALTVPDLKALLKAKKQRVGGKKADLVARAAALAAGKSRQQALNMLTIPALKAILRARYQKVSGKKAVLVGRILSGEGLGTQKPRARSPRAAKRK